MLERYLANHAEPEARSPELVEERPNSHYSKVLSIPAYDEPPEFLDRVLARLRDIEGLLVVVVVNAPDSADPAAVARSRQLLEQLRGSGPAVLAIDRVSRPIPRRQGVGLARKIGADLCCALIAAGVVESPLIHLTDADVILPAGYFEAAAGRVGISLYPFRHVAAEPDLARSAMLYELHMSHYVNGLLEARSPYAFQSLGSTIVTDVDTYVRVRGIPKRNGAEDFYYLNKAAKVAPITSLAAPEIEISARRSSRVPFGTGPALAKMPASDADYLSYAPQVFAQLALASRALEQFALTGAPPGGPVLEWLNELGWVSQARALTRQHPPGRYRQRAVLEWFDGFRSLRLLRLARASFPDVPLVATLRARHGLPQADLAELLDAERPIGERTAGLPPHLESPA